METKREQELSEYNMQVEQRKDPSLRIIVHALNKNIKNHLYAKKYELINSILYKKPDVRNQNLRLVIPQGLRRMILTLHHNDNFSAHVGRDRVFESISRRYFWPGLYNDVQRWMNACIECNKRKPPQPKWNGKLIPITSNAPFELVCIDLLGPFKKTVRGNKYVLVCVDNFTNWVEAAPLRTIEAEEVCDTFIKIIVLQHGCPLNVLTDQGTQFTSNLFKQLCTKLKTNKLQTSAYHPQTNGKAEKFNSFLVNSLSLVSKEDQSDWDEALPYCVFAYRTTIHRIIQDCSRGPSLAFLARV